MEDLPQNILSQEFPQTLNVLKIQLAKVIRYQTNIP
jgi:hypothetical protein